MADDNTLQEGDKAPLFELPADSGETLALKDYLDQNRWVVLYLYPKDETPGCTTEAQDFSEQVEAFDKRDCSIIGMSKDKPAKHDKFIEKHDLKIRLVSDEEGEVINAYGSWVEKNMYGRKYMGIDRSTFLIAPDGSVEKIWRKVRVKGHVAAVLGALEEAQSGD